MCQISSPNSSVPPFTLPLCKNTVSLKRSALPPTPYFSFVRKDWIWSWWLSGNFRCAAEHRRVFKLDWYIKLKKIWSRSIPDYFGVSKTSFVRAHFLEKQCSISLRWPYPNLDRGVRVKHQNLIVRCWTVWNTNSVGLFLGKPQVLNFETPCAINFENPNIVCCL